MASSIRKLEVVVEKARRNVNFIQKKTGDLSRSPDLNKLQGIKTGADDLMKNAEEIQSTVDGIISELRRSASF